MPQSDAQRQLIRSLSDAQLNLSKAFGSLGVATPDLRPEAIGSQGSDAAAGNLACDSGCFASLNDVKTDVVSKPQRLAEINTLIDRKALSLETISAIRSGENASNLACDSGCFAPDPLAQSSRR